MSLKKGDFVEIEFTGKLREGGVFDSNIKEDLEKIPENHNLEAKPFIFSLGEGMFLKGIDDFILEKNPDKFPVEYEIELSPDNAFGKRDTKLIQIAPSRIFKEQKMNPSPGMLFNFDGKIAKVLSVSGGRVIVDFNNPLAGKDVVYKVKISRKVEDLSEKLKSFINFLFKRDIEFEVKDKKLLIKTEKQYVDFVKLFKEKFKEIFDLELEVEEVEEIKKK